ncbi:TPA: hypothetical protein ACIBKF_004077 [Salmonella enterica subsp. enterica serovar 6,7:y:-]
MLLDEDYISRSHACIARGRDFLWQAMARFSSLVFWEPQANFIVYGKPPARLGVPESFQL